MKNEIVATLGSSSKFAVYASVLGMLFVVAATVFSAEGAAMRDHVLLAECLGAPMTIITGAMFKRFATSKAQNGKPPST